MIFFAANDGTIIKGLPSPVYQGAANANTIYLIAPFATNTAVTVAFQLPNGVWTEPAAMTAQNALQGIVNEGTGRTYAGWTYDIPNNITQYYGTVTAQFFFYSAQAGVVTATSATSFEVGRGVPAVLPETPSEDIYEQILSNLAALQSDLNNGYFSARAVYAWNSAYTYGTNEITFYPGIGEFGAFVQSEQPGNRGNAPYADGKINSAWWKEVANFNTITDEFFTEINAARNAAESAQKKAETSQSAAETAAGNAKGFETAASGSAKQAAASAVQSASSETAAGRAATAASESAKQAAQSSESALQSAKAGADSAASAKQYRDEAKDYAKKEYKIVDSYEDLPHPGDAAYIYLVPAAESTASDGYTEYLWIEEKSDYEYVGSLNSVNLDGYAQTRGTYPDMAVGNAENAANAENANRAAADQNGVNIAANYVSVTAQAFSEGQKARARINIDAQKTAEFMTTEDVDNIFKQGAET